MLLAIVPFVDASGKEILVLLSASNAKYGVSCMQEFWPFRPKKKCSFWCSVETLVTLSSNHSYFLNNPKNSTKKSKNLRNNNDKKLAKKIKGKKYLSKKLRV